MKKKDKTHEIIKEEIREEEGCTLRYRLIKKKSLKVASYLMPLYSIEVALIKDGETSKNTVENIFSDIGKALVFYDQLVDNLASPADLPYIMEDRILG
jgi:hypothetical protein